MAKEHSQISAWDLKGADGGLDLNNDQYRVATPWPKLYWLAGQEYYAVLKKSAYFNLKVLINRDQETVSDFYESHWSPSNEEYAKELDAKREILLANNRPVFADGWFLHKGYIELLSMAINRCQVESVLEVGAGRGKNLALLALKSPDLRFAGIELTERGVERSRELPEDLPQKFLTVAGYESATEEQKKALRDIDFQQGSALEMPFADKSFDLSYTCLVLEQIPHLYTQVLKEMRRVTRKHCVFIEPFAEANNISGMTYLRGVDYFRYKYKEFAQYGLEPVYFTTDMPQKVRFKTGLLIAQVVE
ncbi:MAG: class I SAM-dependent methyltransferase [Acidobacteria bacterium]|nr:class I SAM-dependent methyltransferase [Acidobacteriota bacterium]